MTGFEFDNSYARDLAELCEPWRAAEVRAPHLLALNEELATELDLDVEWLRSAEGTSVLSGTTVPDGAASVALAYAGHQFGGLSPRLGDGRALLVGEVIDVHGRRRDVHLKGSGRTPFARGGDGLAAVGPMLRELVIGEAMHALGVPTTRALAVIATGEQVRRDTVLPGAVLVRVAASHIRVGTFQYAALHGGPELVRRLADHAIERHHPIARQRDNPYLGLLASVVDTQARLIAAWMLIGFVHGVMNTDNMTISGETIDYGPCAFLDVHDPATVFSSIDHGGRYAYGNQPTIAQWNLARLAETMLDLVADDRSVAVAAVTEVLHGFESSFRMHMRTGLASKLGLATHDDDDEELAGSLLALMRTERLDHTRLFRALSGAAMGDDSGLRRVAGDLTALRPWLDRWHQRLTREERDPATIAAAMNTVNPVYIPRNHLVEAALTAATGGDLTDFGALLEAVSGPFVERPGLDAYAHPAPESFGRYVTFCGT
ncbi:MAG: protein adenylyltransferase SelO [Ilumatobacteraceae bacterium]